MIFKKRNKTPLVFEIRGKTPDARKSILEEVESNPEFNKKKGKYVLLQKKPPVLKVEHNFLGKWLNKLAAQLGTSVENIVMDPRWQNSVKKKVKKTMEKETGIDRNKFDVQVKL